MSKRASSVWDSRYFKVVTRADKKRVATCVFCGVASFTENATKMKDHLLQCGKVPMEVREVFRPSKRLVAENPVFQMGASSGSSSATVDQTSNSEPAAVEAKQSKMTVFADKMTIQTQEAITVAFARWIYAKNLPLSITESQFFADFVGVIRPGWKIPSRYELSNRYLDQECQKIEAKKVTKLEQTEVFALLSDGWSSVKNKALINFIATCPEPLFLTTVDTKAEQHTGQYIASLLEEKIESLGPEKVLALW